MQALETSNTIATLLPSTAFFLRLPYAPARQLLQRPIALALASDYNPGTTPSGKMPFVLSLACIQMRMLPEEALNAMTINGAYAMDLAAQVGWIGKGQLANLILTKPISSIAFMPYAFGSDWIEGVWIAGERQK
jgi:imidazolonepropionase